MCARPIGAKSLTVLCLIDGQIFIEQAILALKVRDTERALRCMSLAREAQRTAAGLVDEVRSLRVS